MTDVLDEMMWFRKHKHVNCSSIFYQDLYDNIIIRIRDLLKDNDQLMNANELQQKYETNKNVLILHGMLSAIPREWNYFNMQSLNMFESGKPF